VSFIQNTGCRFSSRSRKVPPPTAVIAAMTSSPNRSSPACIAASAPLTAKTATPSKSNQ